MNDSPLTPEAQAAKDAAVRRIACPTIILGSGMYFDFAEPAHTIPRIADIAFGLACTARFRGQCVDQRTGRRTFYSVAEHCVRGAGHAPAELRYPFLMHELGEVVWGDVPGPGKELVPDIVREERKVEAVLRAAYRVPDADASALKMLDLRMLATEQRDLTPASGDRWGSTDKAEPFADRIVPMTWQEAADAFLLAFERLAPQPAKLGGQWGFPPVRD